MEELKPCPFCGEKAYLYVNNGVKVICGTCKASTQALTDRICNRGLEQEGSK